MSAVLMLTFAVCAMAQNVNVTATGGTTSATYPTLTAAFNAVNAGTHTGTITMDVAASTTEPANTSAVLNSSGAGAANYTSVVVRPSVDGVTITGTGGTGSACGGKGLIELNGADNVTIDGDNPNTAGTNRNLTLTDTCIGTYASVVRIALAITVVTSADNNTIRNLIINGSAPGRNIAAATSTTGTENTTYGILATGGASTVAATTAPTAISSTTTVIAAGATANNLIVSNNTITTTARAIIAAGSASTVFPGLQITGNIVGNPTAGAVDGVYSYGISAQGSTNAVISDNTVYVEGFVSTGSRALDVGSVSASNPASTGFTFERNRVNRVQNNSTVGYGAYGINLNAGSNHIVRNNFISGVRNVAASTFDTTFGALGIRVSGSGGFFIYHNSVNMYGNLTGTGAALTTAIGFVQTTAVTTDVRNNIFSNSQTETGAAAAGASAFVSLFLPTTTLTSAYALTLNNNAYYQGGTAAYNGIGQAGTTAGTGFYTAANFDPTTTTPATNLRAYTSTLNAAGTNDNASFALAVPAPFTSNTDLHIPSGTATKLESGGATVGVLTDIDGETRPNGTAPDIGADEFVGVPLPANDIAATAIVTPANGSSVGTGTTVTPQASFQNVGTAAQTNVMVQFTITGPGGFSYSNTQTIASINAGQSITVTFAATPTLTTAGTYTTTAKILTADSNTSNDMITGSFTAVAPVPGGSINVGTGETYTSLTNAGGIFAALNAGGATGNITLNITTDLTGETGAVALNQLAGGFTVTIKPSGAARTISGTSVGTNGGLVILNGADNVTIDGSLSGGTDRSLTINNANTGGADIWIRSADATNGANGNTVKNCVLTGPAANAIAGIVSGGNTFGTAADSPNSNNTVQNILATRVQNALFLSGNAVTFDQNWLITGNTFGSTVAADKLSFRGMLLGGANNFTITQNTIMGVVTASGSTATGIQLSANATNGSVTRNNISDIKNTNTGGFGANGIFLAQTSTTANDLVANNFIRDVAGVGFAGVDQADNGYGIVVASGGGYNIYFNSVNLATSQTTTGSITGAVNILAAVTTAGAVDLRDNVLVNTETVGTRYGVINSSTQGAAVFTVINYNDYLAQNVGLQTSARITLANWQAATGQDANSLAVDPLFVSAADLHLQTGSPMINAGAQTPIAPRESINAPTAVTVDFDGQLRDATPDIGGDEFLGATAAGVNVGGRVVTSAGRGIAGARVYLTDGQGNVTVRQTNGLGYYRFVDVAAGGNYIMTAEHKAYKFPPSQLYFISGEELEINFVAGGGSGKSIGQEPDKRK